MELKSAVLNVFTTVPLINPVLSSSENYVENLIYSSPTFQTFCISDC